MPAGEPRVFVDYCGKPLCGFVIGPLPQGAERARGADDRQIVDAVGRGDLAQLVRHASAAGDARHETLGAFEDSVEHALSAAHFPQHVDIDGALAGRHVICALDLGDRAVDRIFDQLFVAFATSQTGIDLRDDPPFGIIAVGIDRRDGADAAGRRPGTAAGMIGGGHTLAAFDQRPHLAAAIENGLKALEQNPSPWRPCASAATI